MKPSSQQPNRRDALCKIRTLLYHVLHLNSAQPYRRPVRAMAKPAKVSRADGRASFLSACLSLQPEWSDPYTRGADLGCTQGCAAIGS